MVKCLRATPVFAVSDYARSKAFYCEQLGFHVIEEGGDPARFGIFDRDGATIFLDAWNGATQPRDGWSAYIHVRSVDQLASTLLEIGVDMDVELHDTVYGMREFEIYDPDGNRICFGEDLDEIAKR